MKKNIKTTGCGDWHLGWGYGYTTFGKLTLNDDGTFTWKGSSQGRHGQKHWSDGLTHFKVSENGIEIITQKRSLPKHSEVYKAIMVLSPTTKIPPMD
jgi:hypothetical protein